MNSKQPISIKIYGATLAHVTGIAPLFNQYRMFYGQPDDLKGAERFLEERLTKGESFIFAAQVDTGNIRKDAGFMQLYPTFSSISMKRSWILNDLFVDAEFRGLGIGRQLLQRAHDFAVETSSKGLTLTTAIDNVNAQHLYQTFGFDREEEFFVYNLYV